LSHILLIEDERDVRFMVEHTLLNAGHEVDAAATLADGRSLLDSAEYDLVIADVKLPDGLGIDLANQATDRGIRALIMTGYAFSLPAERLKGYDVLLKPLRPIEIIQAVERGLA